MYLSVAVWFFLLLVCCYRTPYILYMYIYHYFTTVNACSITERLLWWIQLVSPIALSGPVKTRMMLRSHQHSNVSHLRAVWDVARNSRWLLVSGCDFFSILELKYATISVFPRRFNALSVFQVSFEFTSQELTLVESFWRFHIPEQNISVPFLLVGQAREPDISMDRSHMNFKALLIGKFKFDMESVK